MGASTFAYLSVALGLCASANAYFLMSLGDILTTQRIDPIVSPGKVSGHTHVVFGGSNFGFTVTTQKLQESLCTTTPIVEDNSNYWFPKLYFQWANGSFTGIDGGAVVYYLFPDPPGNTTAFPPDFRMLSGNPAKRSYDPNSFAQQAITFLCLDFNGVSTKSNSLPNTTCPSGIRSQVNFPSCWDGKNLDSPDHKSHVAFPSGGPDSGTCDDPNFPVVLPRIFGELYWNSNSMDDFRSQAMNPNQPFVFSYGDPYGYGYHADFYNGWKNGVLQNAINNCNCNEFGDATCCGQTGKGIFTLQQNNQCRITPSIDEQTSGLMLKLPGNNPVTYGPADSPILADPVTPAIISPVFAYTGSTPTATGNIVTPATTATGGAAPPPGSVSTPLPTVAPTSGAVPSPGSVTAEPPASSPMPTGTTIGGSAPVLVAVPTTVISPSGTKSPVQVTVTPTVVPVPTTIIGNGGTKSPIQVTVTPTVVPVPTTIIGNNPGGSKPTSIISTSPADFPASPTTTLAASQPSTTKICKKRPQPNVQRRHFARNHRRHDFGADGMA